MCPWNLPWVNKGWKKNIFVGSSWFSYKFLQSQNGKDLDGLIYQWKQGWSQRGERTSMLTQLTAFPFTKNGLVHLSLKINGNVHLPNEMKAMDYLPIEVNRNVYISTKKNRNRNINRNIYLPVDFNGNVWLGELYPHGQEHTVLSWQHWDQLCECKRLITSIFI